ncbi:helix-turn-helix domain-containing protein [Lapidilactobacillus achengensis]|uniref:Helix-turn-helix domain-containing protein n=1 Tax=Lapidilactobacillus achengensis TaxID=2486000 RepID=A0ABW1UL45_9LACO|nr:helix-turn-helix transcriptional regulator [Lapidilactobacillus achengensis]
MLTFGDRLKQRRQQLQLTQTELAQKLNVSRSAVSNWEVGRNYPDLEVLISLSQLLETSVDWLLNDTKPPVINDQPTAAPPLQRKKTRKSIIFLLIGGLLIVLYLLVHNISTIKQTISPIETSVTLIRASERNQWVPTRWNGSPHPKSTPLNPQRLLINAAGNSGTIQVQVSDATGKFHTPAFVLPPGRTRQLKLTGRKTHYRIRIKAKPGQYVLNLR